MFTIVVVFTCAACQYKTHASGEALVSDMYPDELEAAMTSWSRVYGDTSACDVSKLAVVVADDEQFLLLCERIGIVKTHKGEQRLAACTAQVSDHTVIVIGEKFMSQETSVILHELMHWLSACTGNGNQFHHDNDVIWNADDGILCNVCSEFDVECLN